MRALIAATVLLVTHTPTRAAPSQGVVTLGLDQSGQDVIVALSSAEMTWRVTEVSNVPVLELATRVTPHASPTARFPSTTPARSIAAAIRSLGGLPDPEWLVAVAKIRFADDSGELATATIDLPVTGAGSQRDWARVRYVLHDSPIIRDVHVRRPLGSLLPSDPDYRRKSLRALLLQSRRITIESGRVVHVHWPSTLWAAIAAQRKQERRAEEAKRAGFWDSAPSSTTAPSEPTGEPAFAAHVSALAQYTSGSAMRLGSDEELRSGAISFGSVPSSTAETYVSLNGTLHPIWHSAAPTLRVTVNGSPIPVAVGRTFSERVPLEAGVANTIVVTMSGPTEYSRAFTVTSTRMTEAQVRAQEAELRREQYERQEKSAARSAAVDRCYRDDETHHAMCNQRHPGSERYFARGECHKAMNAWRSGCEANANGVCAGGCTMEWADDMAACIESYPAFYESVSARKLCWLTADRKRNRCRDACR